MDQSESQLSYINTVVGRYRNEGKKTLFGERHASELQISMRTPPAANEANEHRIREKGRRTGKAKKKKKNDH